MSESRTGATRDGMELLATVRLPEIASQRSPGTVIVKTVSVIGPEKIGMTLVPLASGRRLLARGRGIAVGGRRMRGRTSLRGGAMIGIGRVEEKGIRGKRGNGRGRRKGRRGESRTGRRENRLLRRREEDGRRHPARLPERTDIPRIKKSVIERGNGTRSGRTIDIGLRGDDRKWMMVRWRNTGWRNIHIGVGQGGRRGMEGGREN